MTLDEAIAHAKEVAENVRYNANTFTESDLLDENCRKAKAECLECVSEHEQLAEWLEELKERREKDRWISVDEALPDKNMSCLVSVGKFKFIQIAIYSDLMGTIDHKIFYQGDYGKNNFQNITEYVNAWRPLPEPYTESEETE